MKFNMYAPTMFQLLSKITVKIISAVFLVVFILLVGLSVYCLCLQSFDLFFFFLILTIILSAVTIGLIFTSKAHIEINDETIKIVDYFLFIKKEKIIEFSHISKAYIQVAKSCRRMIALPKHLPHEIFFEDEAGKSLFSVYYSSESYEVFKDYIVNYDLYLKSIE